MATHLKTVSNATKSKILRTGEVELHTFTKPLFFWLVYLATIALFHTISQSEMNKIRDILLTEMDVGQKWQNFTVIRQQKKTKKKTTNWEQTRFEC